MSEGEKMVWASAYVAAFTSTGDAIHSIREAHKAIQYLRHAVNLSVNSVALTGQAGNEPLDMARIIRSYP